MKNKCEFKKNSFSCFEKRERGLVNPVRIVKRWLRNIKHAYQRIKYGYCERDVWDIDRWFLNVMPNMLQELRETAHGFPFEVSKMVGYDDRNPNPEKDREAKDKWDSILGEMEFYLREANGETCREKNQEEEELRYSYRNECKDKGLKLFGEWFWDLWD